MAGTAAECVNRMCSLPAGHDGPHTRGLRCQATAQFDTVQCRLRLGHPGAHDYVATADTPPPSTWRWSAGMDDGRWSPELLAKLDSLGSGFGPRGVLLTALAMWPDSIRGEDLRRARQAARAETPTPEPDDSPGVIDSANLLGVSVGPDGLGSIRLADDDEPGPEPMMWDDTWPLDDTRYGAPHNMLGHVLLVLWPRVGELVHEHTAEVVPTWRARWRRAMGR